jgi:hypothetical protein
MPQQHFELALLLWAEFAARSAGLQQVRNRVAVLFNGIYQLLDFGAPLLLGHFRRAA